MLRPHHEFRRPLLSGLTCALALVAGCASRAPRPQMGVGAALDRADVLWLERASFGIDAGSLAEYRRLGRDRYLDRQLSGVEMRMPAEIEREIDALEVTRLDPRAVLADLRERRRALGELSDPEAKERARKALNESGDRLAREAASRELLRAVYSPAQLRERLTWFWLNHFSVFSYKANLRWLVGDYAQNAIRPHVTGRFRELVLATLEHPAMLEYLDNAHNAAGHINENYARELLELHTLGVDAGYTQQDVQQLARILTGVGIDNGRAPRLRPAWQGLYVRRGAFEFNPARHDFGAKTLLGHRIEGGGLDEVERAVDLIVRQPACARFISREIARYFVADDPPAALVARMAKTFSATDGDIAAVMRTMLASPEFNDALGKKFKDPTEFVVSAVRLAFEGRPIRNPRPLLNWVGSLGEAPFAHQTPDGYAMTQVGWASEGQLSRRFEIARAIGSGNARLFEPEEPAAPTTAPAMGPVPTAGVPPAANPVRGGFAQLSNRLYFEAIEPFLTAGTRRALDQAASPQEWNTLLLASPDFNYD